MASDTLKNDQLRTATTLSRPTNGFGEQRPTNRHAIIQAIYETQQATHSADDTIPDEQVSR